MDRGVFLRIDWSACLDFLHQERSFIQKKIKIFLKNNPEWEAECTPPIQGFKMAITVLFWLKPENKKRRKVYDYPETRCGYIKPEETKPIGLLVASFIKERNLKVWVNPRLKDGFLEYEIKIEDYSVFIKR
ncbi:MAG: hypothetical protein PHN37_03075 [Candidatus Pacebacteria bacterium]|nr:hypothetical protein [Candidatus Paceibacterota bacterium]